MNMNLNLDVIKTELEADFDIPFQITGGFEGQDPWYKISPKGEGKEFFDVHVRIRNLYRIIITLSFQNYSKEFVETLGKANIEKKLLFSTYANEISKDPGSKITMTINNQEVSPVNSEKWPKLWTEYSLRFTKMPFFNEEKGDIVTDKICLFSKLFLGLVLSLAEIVTEIHDDNYLEGGSKSVLINVYERNSVNRTICLVSNGFTCKICGMNFEHVFGEIGHHFIHVHHIEPVSMHINKYFIDPVNDLIPVCPNCHAMLHRKDPPYLPQELIELLKSRS